MIGNGKGRFREWRMGQMATYDYERIVNTALAGNLVVPETPDTVTGNLTDGTALQSLLTALEDLGLINDGTGA